MVFSNVSKQCLFGRLRILTSISRCAQSSRSPSLQTDCRLFHFQSAGQSRLLQNGIHRFHNQRLQWSHRNFQSRRRMTKEENLVTKQAKQPRGLLIRPFVFTVAVCGVSFTGAMVWQYEVMRYHAKRIMSSERKRKFESMLEKSFGFREHINTMWNNLSQGQKMVAGLIMANCAVFLMWRVPALMPFMTRYFSSQPGGTLSSMLLCSFSHYSFLHLFCNMYVLWSFSGIALSLFGKEQLSAVFLSAAAVSSFTSLVVKTLKGRVVPSLGASGALMAILGAVCVSYPNARLSIAFIGELLPHSFSASTAMTGIILFDAAGLLLGWKLFDHAAHLGGILFGIWYVTYGKDLIWKNREAVMKIWHEVRGNP